MARMALLAFAFVFAGAPLAAKPAHSSHIAPDATIADNFDLAEHVAGRRPVAEDDAIASTRRVPRGLDLRSFAFDPPTYEYLIAEGGPVLIAGAMGGGRKGAPKLLHVMVDWDF